MSTTSDDMIVEGDTNIACPSADSSSSDEGGGVGEAPSFDELKHSPPKKSTTAANATTSSTDMETGTDGTVDDSTQEPTSAELIESEVMDDAAAAAATSAAATEETLKLIDMLRSDEVSDRTSAMGQLDVIASALGKARTRDELVPFLTESVDDEDEVLAVMAEMLGELIPFVGGEKGAHLLLSPLELLLTAEETTVREKSVESAKKVADALSLQAYQSNYVDMLSRLANKEWFTARMSACGLIATSFGRLTRQQQEDRLDLYAKLCRDDTPMVRRVASHSLGILVTNVVGSLGAPSLSQPEGIVPSILLPLYEELARNDQDSVRLQTTENCIAFGRAIGGGGAASRQNDAATGVAGLNENGGDNKDDNANTKPAPLLNPAQQEELTKRILPLLVDTIDDRSWRVRWTAASKFSEAVDAFSNLPGAVEALIPAYEKLLQDPEAEVRTAATFNLSDVARCDGVSSMKLPVSSSTEEGSTADGDVQDVAMDGSADVVGGGGGGGTDASGGPTTTVAERLAKRVATLTDDDSEHVRAALAMVATELAPVLGKDGTITHLLPPLLLLLRDSSSEVRLNLISSLSPLNDVIGVDLLSQSLLPAIVDLSEDSKWRIRLAIIKHIPILAKQLGEEFFSDKLSALCVAWLGDDISSIRQAAATNLMELSELFGSKWALVHLLPSLTEIRQHTSYLRRLTAVQACALMATKMDNESARNELLPMVMDLANDSVPNIRFNVAKALEMMAPVCGLVAYTSQIRPLLSVLSEDADRDVRYFAEKALETLETEFGDGSN